MAEAPTLPDATPLPSEIEVSTRDGSSDRAASLATELEPEANVDAEAAPQSKCFYIKRIGYNDMKVCAIKPRGYVSVSTGGQATVLTC